MAQYADNDIYLDIDGTAVSSYFKRVSLEPAIETNDTTSGSGTDFRSRAVGLKDYSITIEVAYDTTDIATQLLLFKPGAHTVTYGPEGNAAGKPKHVQSFIFTGAPFEVNVEKTPVVFSVSGEGAAAPTTDIFNGGVWA
ncbi:MAG: hypothetical protein M5U29_07360 [Anaerolineae bacterium]|nr:hypothetical protein [Anaerolineae bacterium]